MLGNNVPCTMCGGACVYTDVTSTKKIPIKKMKIYNKLNSILSSSGTVFHNFLIHLY